jgi:hypothetical protein
MRLVPFLLFASLALYGKIIETPHFGEIEKYADQDTLLLLDIDDTLLIPAQTLGTDVWFCHQIEQNKLAGSPDPLDEALALWEAVRHLTRIEVVEKGADELVEKLQKRKMAVMGLTSQGLALATRTVNQLQSLHFDLSKTAPSKEDCYFQNDHGVLYRKGILFTSGTHKGRALLKFLELADLHPKRVVFLNDKQAHLKEVEKSLKEVGIPFVGLRYSYSDARVQKFRPEIADIQLSYSTFGRIISDEEAEEIYRETLQAEAESDSFSDIDSA